MRILCVRVLASFPECSLLKHFKYTYKVDLFCHLHLLCVLRFGPVLPPHICHSPSGFHKKYVVQNMHTLQLEQIQTLNQQFLLKISNVP